MAKNTHLEHIEDDIVNSGKSGGLNAVKFLRELGDMLSQPRGASKLTITTKWDGAPAVICGKDPNNGMFFVGTKSVFNKTNPKIAYTEQLIDYHYPNPGLNSVLKTCFKYLPALGITGILQGDLLFTDNKTIKSINNESVISFQPNTIVYTVPVDSIIGKEINSAKMGIVFHTSYSGTSFSSLSASFGVDISVLKKSIDVYTTTATFNDMDGVARFTDEEKEKYKSLVNKAEGSLKQASGFLNEIKEFGEGRFVMSPMFKAYMNTYFRDVNKVFTNVKEIANGFVQYYSMQLDKEIASKKTKSTQDKYIKIKTDGLTFLKTNERPLYFTIASYMNIIEAKLYVIRRLEMVKTLGTFLRTDNGYKVTAPEGFVAIQSGNALKLVDRLEFSRANFTAAKNWDQG
tara:strand:+ start:236 stop:1441 length:1206 start_codon:yes stop_codon:yes gene_type:complete